MISLNPMVPNAITATIALKASWSFCLGDINARASPDKLKYVGLSYTIVGGGLNQEML